ncbi:NIPSNAP family protein [Terracidiphilus sp.]|jgi:hypothetical protein|uniref:NIPSNAP family protein n=1 Tax=Terracidiphilus sp. TaxID=1964191 RepID=UPI003C187327
MNRRKFLSSTLAASAATLASAQEARTEFKFTHRQFYLLRRYTMQTGPQTALTEKYLSEALIPALTRRNRGSVGAFRLEVGPETPSFYVLIPGNSPVVTMIEEDLAADAEYLKAAEPFLAAPATSPAFLRVDSSLLVAFRGWPGITPPAKGAKRIFQLRTYESPSFHAHEVKVKMFHSGEFDIFKAAGFRPVFFGDTLVGPRMPSLTYMLAFDDTAQLDAQWNTFRNDPNWKKLSADPRFAYEAIVSNITNLYLSPLSASQI